MKKYVFVSNSTKPTMDRFVSLDNIKPNNFSRPCLEAANQLGYSIYLGVNRKTPEKIKVDLPFKIKLYNSNTYRSLFNIRDNLSACRNLYALVKNEQIDVIHCNTPIGGLVGRLVGKKLGVQTVIYTAHGFHFFKGNTHIKNLIFRKAESIMARWTDAIITMNQEDYQAAKAFKLKKGGKVYFVHGVGIDLDEFNKLKVDKTKKRKELGVGKEDIIIISVGDLTKNKNIGLSLDIIAQCHNPRIKYLICGEGPELDKMRSRASALGISEQVRFLGYRNDIKELLGISDIFLSTTKREGLPRSLMEAMAAGVPCIVSRIRGNIDLIEERSGGYCCRTMDEYLSAIRDTLRVATAKKFSEYNLKKIKDYDIIKVRKEIKDIYTDIGL